MNMASTGSEMPLLNEVVTGSVDFKSRPSIRLKSGGWKSASYIIGVEMAERFASFGISSNLVSYLTGPMGQSTARAVMNISVWSGIAALTPLFGAFVADAFLGRYRTIMIASLLYSLALGFLSLSAALHSSDCKNTVGTCPPSTFHAILFFSSLYSIALVQGGHRPCIQAFGADQFDDEDPREWKAKASFFNWWNFFLAGSILAALYIMSYIQENLSWELGYGIPSILMLFSVLVFSLGTCTYRFHISSNERNPFMRIGSGFAKVVSDWNASPRGTSVEEACAETPSDEITQFESLDKSLLSSICSKDHGSDDIEDAKAILKLVPLWCTCLTFSVVCTQAPTLFTKQGATMERHVTPNFEIPSASLQSFINIGFMLFLPVYDLIFVPLARTISKISSGITMLQRIGTGLFLSTTAMIIASLVERKRLAVAVEYGLVDLPKATVPMSIWWLVPQYVVFGISDCFAIVGLQELFYTELPCELKSVGLAMFSSIFGIGNFLNSFLIYVIETATGGDGKESWFSDNLNRAHLDYFYWLLTVLSTISCVAYVYLAKSYDYTKKAGH